jgi:hypothetical protein
MRAHVLIALPLALDGSYSRGSRHRARGGSARRAQQFSACGRSRPSACAHSRPAGRAGCGQARRSAFCRGHSAECRCQRNPFGTPRLVSCCSVAVRRPKPPAWSVHEGHCHYRTRMTGSTIAELLATCGDADRPRSGCAGRLEIVCNCRARSPGCRKPAAKWVHSSGGGRSCGLPAKSFRRDFFRDGAKRLPNLGFPIGSDTEGLHCLLHRMMRQDMTCAWSGRMSARLLQRRTWTRSAGIRLSPGGVAASVCHGSLRGPAGNAGAGRQTRARPVTG